MSGDLDRLLSDAAATASRDVDVEAMHARAQRSPRLNRLVAGLCAVALLAVGAAAVVAVSTGEHRVDLSPADAPAGTGTVGWPLRLRAEATMHPTTGRGVPVVIDLEGTAWEDWLVVAASGPPDAVSVKIATADHRYGNGEDWVVTDEPYTLLEEGAEVVASAPQAAYTTEERPWWDDTRPGPLPHPLPHALLRPWQASVAALNEPVEVIEPAGAWAERRAEVAARLDLPDDAVSLHAWEIGPAEDCPSAQPADCMITVTAVVLTDADLPLLVELDGPAAGSGRLEVTHLDVTASQRQPEQAPGGAPDATVDPVALVGLWEVLDAGEPAGAILRLDVRSLRLFRDCGAIYGDWDADHDGLFVAGGGAWSGECAAAGDDPIPGWLLAAAAHRPDGDGHVLLDGGGSVVARLVPGEEPTLPPTILPSEAAPPVVTDDTRRQLAPAEPLPVGVAPADGRTLVGRWTPTDAPEDSESHARFAPDASWNGSDGCNGLGGRWRAGSKGALLATGTGSTDIGCENIAVETRLTRAARAGFDGATLVLYDRQGAELGRFESSDGAASPEGNTDESLDKGDLPPVDVETAAAQRARFAQAVGEDYDATVLVRCFCPSTAPVRIEVRGGVLTRATRAPGTEQEEDVTGDAGSVGVPTVDGIHAILERVAAEGEGRVQARYDDRGVPLRAEVDHRTDAVDDEVTYLVSDVVATADPA